MSREISSTIEIPNQNKIKLSLDLISPNLWPSQFLTGMLSVVSLVFCSFLFLLSFSKLFSFLSGFDFTKFMTFSILTGRKERRKERKEERKGRKEEERKERNRKKRKRRPSQFLTSLTVSPFLFSLSSFFPC